MHVTVKGLKYSVLTFYIKVWEYVDFLGPCRLLILDKVWDLKKTEKHSLNRETQGGCYTMGHRESSSQPQWWGEASQTGARGTGEEESAWVKSQLDVAWGSRGGMGTGEGGKWQMTAGAWGVGKRRRWRSSLQDDGICSWGEVGGRRWIRKCRFSRNVFPELSFSSCNWGTHEIYQ